MNTIGSGVIDYCYLCEEGDMVYPDSESLMRNLYDMMLIRRFEEVVARMYGMGHIGGFCHLYIGQEAVVVGVFSEICVPEDQVITS